MGTIIAWIVLTIIFNSIFSILNKFSSDPRVEVIGLVTCGLLSYAIIKAYKYYILSNWEVIVYIIACICSFIIAIYTIYRVTKFFITGK